MARWWLSLGCAMECDKTPEVVFVDNLGATELRTVANEQRRRPSVRTHVNASIVRKSVSRRGLRRERPSRISLNTMPRVDWPDARVCNEDLAWPRRCDDFTIG